VAFLVVKVTGGVGASTEPSVKRTAEMGGLPPFAGALSNGEVAPIADLPLATERAGFLAHARRRLGRPRSGHSRRISAPAHASSSSSAFASFRSVVSKPSVNQ
jgi:hypothetical protein